MLVAIVTGIKVFLIIAVIVAFSVAHTVHINGFDRHTFWGEFGATVIYVLFCLMVMMRLW